MTTRIVLAVAVGAAVAGVTGVSGSWGYAPSVGWDCAATVFLVWTWLVIARLDPAQTESHATAEDPIRQLAALIVLGAATASLVGVGYLLVQAASTSGARQGVVAALGVISVAVSWAVVHTLFTLHHALLYYSEPVGGIEFNQSEPPRYAGFAYLAFTIGMTFQVSDTGIRAPRIRTSVLLHALLSYLFGSLILGAMVNLIVSLASSSG